MADKLNPTDLKGKLEQIANKLYEVELLSLRNRKILFGDKFLIEENDENINCFAEDIENFADGIRDLESMEGQEERLDDIDAALLAIRDRILRIDKLLKD